jgi:hypothetical protein
MENRNGLVVNTRVTQATGTAEREAAVEMIQEISGDHRVTVGADKNYDTKDFVKQLRGMKVTPHVSQKRLHGAIDGRPELPPDNHTPCARRSGATKSSDRRCGGRVYRIVMRSRPRRRSSSRPNSSF